MNTLQISRGDLLSRLSAKPLASGELFVHISKSVSIQGKTVYDLVTRSFLTVIEKGDLFVGAGDDSRVYSIGSGGNLKWGGVLFNQSSYDEVKEVIKKKPNTLFLYNGTNTLALYDQDGEKTNGLGQPQPNELTNFADGNHGEAWANKINPGDLVFYYPALDQLVVLPLSRATDATTRIELNNLVSSAMTNTFADCSDVTLQDFLNKPVRHYQYLLDKEGWEKVVVSTNTDGQKVLSLTNDFDGAIHYVPFDKDYPGVDVYTHFEGQLATDLANKEVKQGDLIISLPSEVKESATGKAGVKHVIVSLYGDMVSSLTMNEDLSRADEYATQLWKTAVEGTTGYGTDHLGDDAFKAKYKQLSNFIRRLYETKVDIDPTTGKIISSQLPDFLLGAPKYQGHLNLTISQWDDTDLDITPTEFLTKFSTQFGITTSEWENLDGNEDDTSSDNPNNVDASKEINDKLKSGCYWIYTGETVDINDFTKLFHNDDYDKDDITTGEESDLTHSDTDDFNSVSQHLLNKGDWIIYNSEKDIFEVIDNTSSFVGILVHTSKIAGIADFHEGTRTGNYFDKDSLQSVESADTTELSLNASSNKITFSGPKTVLFKNQENSVLTSKDFLPVISGDGFASNSRLGFEDNQRTITIGNLGIESAQNPQGLEKLSFKLVDLERTNTSKEEKTQDYINDAFGLLQETTTSKYSFEKREADDTTNPNTVTSFDFGSVSYFSQYKYGTDPDSNYYYGFDISGDQAIKVSLPAYDGVLTTEEYVNRGFTVTKLMIEDAVKFIEKKASSGNIEWVQTVRYMRDEDGNLLEDEDGNNIKELFDSAIQEQVETGKFLKLNLHSQLSPDYTENTKNLINTLATYNTIEKGSNNVNGPLDLHLKKVTLNAEGILTEEQIDSTPFNPSVATGDVENILPNHSGVLLNNNSVIDGGVWGVVED